METLSPHSRKRPDEPLKPGGQNLIQVPNVLHAGTGSSCGNNTTHSDGTPTGNSTVKCYSNSNHATQVDCTFS